MIARCRPVDSGSTRRHLPSTRSPPVCELLPQPALFADRAGAPWRADADSYTGYWQAVEDSSRSRRLPKQAPWRASGRRGRRCCRTRYPATPPRNHSVSDPSPRSMLKPGCRNANANMIKNRRPSSERGSRTFGVGEREAFGSLRVPRFGFRFPECVPPPSGVRHAVGASPCLPLPSRSATTGQLTSRVPALHEYSEDPSVSVGVDNSHVRLSVGCRPCTRAGILG